ncbi:Zn-ribbon domain-containing OB-fold protein [Bailinhaonella thermotolerans]|uniref:Benzoylsuccinyl-CoA thiolase n=1 Tax=Bailinhaonella thermotolerans TaxID=1070861 RepID=A0A3A4B4Y0_9ACTN|nr:OB-fold domain-containing protein [Bailinhaonella thermotolerans]RJL33121.1 benzoylsuccinyl-CoA thiolase [Bailinhaonella thermotolerans]
MDAEHAVDGWFVVDAGGDAHLLGARCAACGNVSFPRFEGFCRNPGCEGTEQEEVRLSRRGRVWSYTNAGYPPPPPYVAAEPYTPVTLAAVELAGEGLVVLGQVVPGIGVDELRVGMEMELTCGPLADGPLVWMWRPAAAAA